jgi:predicted nucleic acid-binding protein
VNAFELFFGAYKSGRKEENLKETSKLLDSDVAKSADSLG